MGLLDDAIREHLELKRRRGADPTEIEQLEQEALGPVRSVAQEIATDVAEYPESESALADQGTGHELGHEAEYDDEEDGDWVEEDDFDEPEASHAGFAEPAHEEFTDTAGAHGVVPPPGPVPADEDLTQVVPPSGRPPEAEALTRVAPPPEPEPEPEPVASPASERESVAPVPERESTAADLEPEPVAPPGPVTPDPGMETAEYDVEAEHAGEEDGEGDDMLEETPEFLQDTPDHDRLWFEQRPPKDFDFDG